VLDRGDGPRAAEDRRWRPAADATAFGSSRALKVGQPSTRRSRPPRRPTAAGFAIPIDTAKQVLAQLKRGEEIKRAFLGVKTSDAATGTGAVVASVVAGGPADEAGLREGDRVVSVSGRGDGERMLSTMLGTRPAQG